MFRWRSVLVVVGLSLAAAGVSAPASSAALAAEDRPPCSVQVGNPGDTVSGVVTVSITVNEVESHQPDQTELFVDGVLVGTDETPRSVTAGGCSGDIYYSEVQWDTTVWPNGPHQLTARATRADGEAFWSDNTITSTVDN